MFKPASLIKEVEVDTVGELRLALATCPDEMPVTDAVGEPLILRFYEDEGEKFLEAA